MKKIINFFIQLRYSWMCKKWCNESSYVPCSVCGQPLVDGGLKEYETLNDHVCDPNGENIELAPTLICVNEKCKAHNTGFWSYREDGDWFAYAINVGERCYSKYIQCPRLVTSFYLGFIDIKNYNRKGIYVGKKEY